MVCVKKNVFAKVEAKKSKNLSEIHIYVLGSASDFCTRSSKTKRSAESSSSSSSSTKK